MFYKVEGGVGFLNPETLTTTGSNTNKVIGGEGLFEGATGTQTGSEVYQVANLLVDPTSASKGIVKINGAITAAFVGVGVGTFFLHLIGIKMLENLTW